MQPLPAPDELEFELPPGHVCLVCAERTGLTVPLIRRMVGRGWSVVLLESAVAGEQDCQDLPDGVPVVTLAGDDEDTVREALAAVALHGPVGTAVIVQPQTETASWDLTALRLPFLLAKYLQPTLNTAAAHPAPARAAFVTVTALDGALGVTGAPGPTGAPDRDPIAAGTFGLTKSLRLEWPGVFCRAIDLDPVMVPEAAADAIMAEVCDPDRLTAEVGWGPQGRVTLTVDPAHRKQEA